MKNKVLTGVIILLIAQLTYAQNTSYKVTLISMYTSGDANNNSVTTKHKVYGSIGIRLKTKRGELPNLENKSARSWDVSKSVPVAIITTEKRKLVIDPTGEQLSYNGKAVINGQRSFTISQEDYTDSSVIIQANMGMTHLENHILFNWKQRSIPIHKIVLGEQYLVVLKGKENPNYGIAISFKIKKKETK